MCVFDARLVRDIGYLWDERVARIVEGARIEPRAFRIENGLGAALMGRFGGSNNNPGTAIVALWCAGSAWPDIS